jgi:transcriptional regulator with XRE-family HTH domain
MEQTSLVKSYRQALGRVLSRLTSAKRTLKDIAAESGVPYGTVKNIANGVIKNPNVEALEALDRTLNRNGKQQH